MFLSPYQSSTKRAAAVGRVGSSTFPTLAALTWAGQNDDTIISYYQLAPLFASHPKHKGDERSERWFRVNVHTELKLRFYDFKVSSANLICRRTLPSQRATGNRGRGAEDLTAGARAPPLVRSGMKDAPARAATVTPSHELTVQVGCCAVHVALPSFFLLNRLKRKL